MAYSRTPGTTQAVVSQPPLDVGQETVPRFSCNSNATLTSGTVRFVYFTARKTETAAKIRMVTTATAAGATPTLVRFGLYTVAANGDLTQVGATNNATTVFAAANTAYERNLATPTDVTAGQRYAVAVLVVTAATAPTTAANASSLPGSEIALAPHLAKSLTGQTDLNATYTAASLADSTLVYYAVVSP